MVAFSGAALYIDDLGSLLVVTAKNAIAIRRRQPASQGSLSFSSLPPVECRSLPVRSALAIAVRPPEARAGCVEIERVQPNGFLRVMRGPAIVRLASRGRARLDDVIGVVQTGQRLEKGRRKNPASNPARPAGTNPPAFVPALGIETKARRGLPETARCPYGLQVGGPGGS